MRLKSLNVRIAALFAAIFLACAALLFLFAYLLLSSSLAREDRAALQSRLLEFWATYQTGGIELVRRELSLERVVSERRAFMLRVAGPGNNTLFIYVPSSLTGYPLGLLEQSQALREGQLARLRSTRNRSVLEVASLRLPDGNLLQIGMSDASRIAILRRFQRTFLLVLNPLVALSVLGGVLFSSRTLTPIKRLIEVTRGIVDTGQMRNRIPPTGTGDELDELIALFNQMLGKIDSLIKGMRSSLDAVAHDLRTPLTRLRSSAEAAVRGTASLKECRAALTGAIAESDQLLNQLRTLMDISEAETGVMRLQRATLDLASVVADMAELYSYGAEEKKIELSSVTPSELTASVDLNRMRQVIANLLDNAIKYTPAGGRVTIEARRDDSEILITVADTGQGIPPEEIAHIFDRLYRGDRSRSQPGLGLGLSLVKAIVEAHGGSVSVSSRPNAGSEFTIRLPA